jgi:hypothetical protein
LTGSLCGCAVALGKDGKTRHREETACSGEV